MTRMRRRSASRPSGREGVRGRRGFDRGDKLKNSVAFSGNAQTAAVRLRHARAPRAARRVGGGGGALLASERQGMVGSARAPAAAPTDVGQVLRELGVELDESELEGARLSSSVRGNAVPVEAVAAAWRGAWQASASRVLFRAG